MPIAIALVALHAAQPAPPPQAGGMTTNVSQPPIMVVNTAPPPPVAIDPSRPVVYAIPEANEAPPDLIELRVTSGRELLWEGRLRVGKPGASLIQYIHQTDPAGCPESRHANSVFSSVHVSVQRWKLSTSPAGAFNYPVRVSWQRPSSERGCMAGGARTVEVKEGVDLRPGQATTLKGDVGLTVWVRRR